MKKKKPTAKRIYHRLTLWLGVLVLGTIVGISIQFGQAWVEPSLNAPDGNIAAPINTGASEQTKIGTTAKKADICVDPYGKGEKKCLSDLVSFPACTLAGGVPNMLGSITICKFPGASCPIGWSQYLKYTETAEKTCTGGGNCGNSVTSGSHLFGNIDPVTEMRYYQDGNQPSYGCVVSQESYCPQWGDCWYDSSHSCCDCCSWATRDIWGTCYGSCNSTVKPCNPTVTATGCVHN